MSPGGVLEAAVESRKTLVHYAREPGDFSERFAARNVDVTFRELPAGGPDPFVTVRDDAGFRGAVTVATLEGLLAPPGVTVHDQSAVSPAYGALLELLDDTVFASLSRRQLLATTREFEDRAWRVGSGVLHVGFQTVEAFEPQRSLYRRLATETDLDVHVHLAGADVDVDAVTVHRDSEYAGDYWVVAFDGPGDSQCALVAKQTGEDDYEGAWTYDPGLVARVVDDLTTDEA
jgi:hypothetical protein